MRIRACSSVVEQDPYKVEVEGPIPSRPTKLSNEFKNMETENKKTPEEKVADIMEEARKRA